MADFEYIKLRIKSYMMYDQYNSHQNTSLHFAVYYGSDDLIERLRSPEHLFTNNKDKETPFLWICLFHPFNQKIKKLLIRHLTSLGSVATLSSKTTKEDTSIGSSERTEQTIYLKSLYAMGITYVYDFIKIKEFINDEFHIACQYPNLAPEIFKTILSGTKDINSLDSAGNTPLYIAVRHDNFRAFEAILLSVTPNTNSNGHKSPLELAIAYGKNDMALKLLKHPDITINNSMISDALINCGESVVIALIDKGIDVNYIHPLAHTMPWTNVDNLTPNILRKLLTRADYDPNIQNNWGDTLLHTFLKENRPDLVDILIEDGRALFNIKNKDEETAITLAEAKDIDLGLPPSKCALPQ